MVEDCFHYPRWFVFPYEVEDCPFYLSEDLIGIVMVMHRIHRLFLIKSQLLEIGCLLLQVATLKAKIWRDNGHISSSDEHCFDLNIITRLPALGL